MKLKFIVYISLTFYFIFLISCEREYDIGENYNHQRIVVDCIFNTDSVPVLQLSKALSPYFGSSYSDLDSVKIMIFGTSDTIDDFEYTGNGLYKANKKLKPKSLYHLSININDTVVTSQSYLPESIIVNSAIHQEVKLDNSKKLLKSQFNISTVGEKYLILTHVVQKKSLTNNNDTIEFENDVWIEGENNFFDKVFPEESAKKILFKKLDSNNVTFTIYSTDGYVKDDNVIEGKSFFNFYSCSEEYYDFVKSKILYKLNNIDNKSSIVNTNGIYSNISNGLGVFAGYNSVTVSNKFK